MTAVARHEIDRGFSTVSDNMILIPGGTFRMGSDKHNPE